MPIYMDRHYLAHNTDLAVQDQYRVRFLTYWFYEVRSTAFCLVDSPDKGNHQASPPGVARPAPPHRARRGCLSVQEAFAEHNRQAPSDGSVSGSDCTPANNLGIVKLKGLREVRSRLLHPMGPAGEFGISRLSAMPGRCSHSTRLALGPAASVMPGRGRGVRPCLR
jgi:hypothetical protein